jgi:hypothetical protein
MSGAWTMASLPSQPTPRGLDAPSNLNHHRPAGLLNRVILGKAISIGTILESALGG